MEFKRDEELFEGLGGPHTFSDVLEDSHADRYEAAVSAAIQKVGRGLKIKYKYGMIDGVYHTEYEQEKAATQVAIDIKMSQLFREVNRWQERDDLAGPLYVGKFASIRGSSFQTYDGKKFHMDYFEQMAKNSIWLEGYVESLYFAKLNAERALKALRSGKRDRVIAVISAVLTVILFGVLKSKWIWEGSTLLALLAIQLPFIAGLCGAVALVRYLLDSISYRKSVRQSLYSEFTKEAEDRLPRVYRTLRFYELWAQDQKRTFPDKLLELRQFVEEASALYDQIAGSQIP